MVERPAKTLDRDARHDGGDAGIGGGGEIGFDAALRHAVETDAFGVRVVAGLQPVHKAHHVPRGVEEKRVLVRLGRRTEGAEECVLVGRRAALAGRGALAVVAAVNCDRHEAAIHERAHERPLVLLFTAGAVEQDDDRQPPGRVGGFEQDAGHALAGFGGEGEAELVGRAGHSVGREHVGNLRRERHARAVEQLQEIRTRIRRAHRRRVGRAQRREGEEQGTESENQGAGGDEVHGVSLQ